MLGVKNIVQVSPKRLGSFLVVFDSAMIVISNVLIDLHLFW